MFRNTVDEDNHAKHDAINQEAVMSVKLSLTNDMFTLVQDNDDAFKIWGH